MSEVRIAAAGDGNERGLNLVLVHHVVIRLRLLAAGIVSGWGQP